MTISFEVPRSVGQAIAAQGGHPAEVAKEAALVELFRQGSIDHSQLAEALGLSRYEADGVLKRHGVLLPISAEQQAGDVEALRRLVQR